MFYMRISLVKMYFLELHSSNVFHGRKYAVLIALVLDILSSFCIADIEVLYHKEVCEEKEFYSPYVKLLKTRQPQHEHTPILKILSSGYLDVSRHAGILCINGPAIPYTDINPETNPGCTDTSVIPSQGEPKVFTHECFSINRLAKRAYQHGEEQGLQKDSQVFGNKVFGVYLVGTGPDFRAPTFTFLPHADFGYTPPPKWCVHEGASLAYVADGMDTSTHCYSVKRYNMEGTVTAPYPGNPIFCYREDLDADFDTPWHTEKEKPLVTEEISWDEDLMEPCVASGKKAKDLEQEPFQLPDFRIIHPKFWSSQGSRAVLYKAKRVQGMAEETPVFSRPHPPGSLFPGEPGWQDPAHLTHSGEIMESIGKGGNVPYRKFYAEISACDEIPVLGDNCTTDDDIKEPCAILNHVLTLEETDWKSDQLKEGSWRVPIFKLVDTIFEKACPQLAKFLPSALSRLFQYFLKMALEEDASLAAKFKEPEKPEWSEILMDLEKCRDNAEKMVLYKKRDVGSMKLRAKLEAKLSKLQETMVVRKLPHQGHQLYGNNSDGEQSPSESEGLAATMVEIQRIEGRLNEIPLKFPYEILIGTAANPGFVGATTVFQYREAAEIDYELDWALDAYWKVVSTVLGFCNMHYASRDAATFMRLYDRFSQDFFEHVTNLWIKGDNRVVYEGIFGEFIHGSGALWMDACSNGAYQWTEKVDLRPLRPLPLTEGEVPPLLQTTGADAGGNRSAATTPAPANFFLDHPTYSKSSDHLDYENANDEDDDPKMSVQISGNEPPEEVPSQSNDANSKPPIMQTLETTGPLAPVGISNALFE